MRRRGGTGALRSALHGRAHGRRLDAEISHYPRPTPQADRGGGGQRQERAAAAPAPGAVAAPARLRMRRQLRIRRPLGDADRGRRGRRCDRARRPNLRDPAKRRSLRDLLDDADRRRDDTGRRRRQGPVDVRWCSPRAEGGRRLTPRHESPDSGDGQDRADRKCDTRAQWATGFHGRPPRSAAKTTPPATARERAIRDRGGTTRPLHRRLPGNLDY
jgi:hypothetical protein